MRLYLKSETLQAHQPMGLTSSFTEIDCLGPTGCRGTHLGRSQNPEQGRFWG